MTFRDDVDNETRKNGTICKTCRILEKLPPKDRLEVAEVLGDPSCVAEAIARAMTRRGWEVSGSAIRSHRRNCLSPN